MADTPRRGTQSIERTFDILDVIAAQSPHGVTLKDICAIAGLSPATAHRMLGILLDRGIVERLSGGKRYVVGRELTLLGLSSELRRFREIASPSLSWLSETVGDAIFLSVRSGHDTVCADRRIGQFPIHQHIERASHDKVGAPNDIDRDCGSKERVRERPSGFGNDDDGGNNYPVHQQVPFVVQGIGADRDGL